MKYIKNAFIGFIVSMVGSLPLGYINVIALKIFQVEGIQSLSLFLFGVVLVEFFLILLTLRAAAWLHRHEKFTIAAEVISILFMLALAFSFYDASATTEKPQIPGFLAHVPPFLLGIALNCINFVQVPFWLGWNIYLTNAEWIEVQDSRKYAYVAGTSAGTFTGVFLFVKIVEKFLRQASHFSPWLSVHLFSVIFVALAVFQSVQFYRKRLQPQG